MHRAAAAGNLRVMAVLRHYDARTLRLFNDRGLSPLALSAEAGNMRAVRFLLRANAGLAASPIDGRTALHIAVERGSIELTQLLITSLEPGRRLEALSRRDAAGRSPLALARERPPVMAAIEAAFGRSRSLDGLDESEADISRRGSEEDGDSLLGAGPPACERRGDSGASPAAAVDLASLDLAGLASGVAEHDSSAFMPLRAMVDVRDPSVASDPTYRFVDAAESSSEESDEDEMRPLHGVIKAFALAPVDSESSLAALVATVQAANPLKLAHKAVWQQTWKPLQWPSEVPCSQCGASLARFASRRSALCRLCLRASCFFCGRPSAGHAELRPLCTHFRSKSTLSPIITALAAKRTEAAGVNGGPIDPTVPFAVSSLCVFFGVRVDMHTEAAACATSCAESLQAEAARQIDSWESERQGAIAAERKGSATAHLLLADVFAFLFATHGRLIARDGEVKMDNPLSSFADSPIDALEASMCALEDILDRAAEAVDDEAARARLTTGQAARHLDETLVGVRTLAERLSALKEPE